MAELKFALNNVPIVFDEEKEGWCYLIGPRAIQRLHDRGLLEEWINDGSLVLLSMGKTNA